ncbi:hypothetical protein EV281_105368 [Rhizobium sp. BK418]|nr:hypothetical protein EV281_105368 [Rhizobium sp. BK418]
MQAEGSTARLLLSSLADKKKRTADGTCPEAEPAAFRQAEMQGIAAYFENNGRESCTFNGSFRQPERILQLARRGVEKPFRLQPEIFESRRIRTTRLQCADRIADPEERQLPAGIFLLSLKACRNGHRQAACGPRIARRCCTELGNCIEL